VKSLLRSTAKLIVEWRRWVKNSRKRSRHVYCYLQRSRDVAPQQTDVAHQELPSVRRYSITSSANSGRERWAISTRGHAAISSSLCKPGSDD
jgi:hypothetical protein